MQVPHCGWVTYQTGGCWPHGQPTIQYNEWSGFLSIVLPWLLQATTFAAVLWWHHQCHVSGCYWPTRRKTAAGERACWRHHPAPVRTAGDLCAAHEAALATTEGEGK